MKPIAYFALAALCFFIFSTRLLVPRANASDVPAACTGQTVDVSDYIAPNCGGPCPTINSSSVTVSERYIGNVSNYVEWIPGTDVFKQHSNDIHFLYRFRGGFIGIMQDTIWGAPDGGTYNCLNGAKAMYRVFDGDNPGDTSQNNLGAKAIPQNFTCGQPFSHRASLIGYEKIPEVETDVFVGLNQCDVENGQYSIAAGPQVVENTVELFYADKALCNPDQNNNTVYDVIGIRNVSGAGAGEVFFYCKGYGLCAWYQELDFGMKGNDPNEWDADTDVCNLTGGTDDIYVHPIEGLKNGDSAQIAFSLAEQGYTVQCTAPKIAVFGEQGGLFDRLPPTGIWTGLEATQVFDYSDAEYPLFRQVAPESIHDSIEAYYGFQTTEEEENSQAIVKSGVAYNLLSKHKQCLAQVEILEKTKHFCDKLENPSACALYTPIPETSFTTKTLLEAYTSSGFTCDQLEKNNPPSGSNESLFYDVQEGISNTPLFLEKSYRIGFLVVAAENKNTRQIPGSFFHFLSKDQPNNNHAVKVLAFKIPDFATNKPYGEDYYADPLQLVYQAYREETFVESDREEEAGRRASFAEQIRSVSLLGPGENPPVNCGQDCGSALANALVNVINANGISCEAGPQDLRYEPSNTIGDSIELSTSEDRVFVNPDEEDPVEVLDTQYQVDSTATFEFLSEINAGYTGAANSETKFTSFLILPVGAELEIATDILAGQILTAEGYDTFRADPSLNHYFKLDGVIQELESSRPPIPVPLPENDPCVLANIEAGKENILEGCDSAEVYITAKQDDHEPRVLGGLLGNVMRAVQQSFFEVGSEPYNYVASCETTEDYLLGRCSGKPPFTPGDINDDNVPRACPFIDKETEIISVEELKSQICAVSEEFQVPGFMLRGIFATEGGPARDAVFAGRTGETVACNPNATGDVGPMQIHVDACWADGKGAPYTSSLDVCRFDDSIRFAASILKSKSRAAIAAGAPAPAGGLKQNWSYELAYYAAGRYNGAGNDCVEFGPSQAEPLSGGVLTGPNGDEIRPVSYCKYVAEAFDSNSGWRCPNDPGPWSLGETFTESFPD